jgi:hypothetical protein
VAPGAESVKAKVADVALVGFAGELVICGVGVDGIASTEEIHTTETTTATRAATTATMIVALLGALVGRWLSMGIGGSGCRR